MRNAIERILGRFATDFASIADQGSVNNLACLFYLIIFRLHFVIVQLLIFVKVSASQPLLDLVELVQAFIETFTTLHDLAYVPLSKVLFTLFRKYNMIRGCFIKIVRPMDLQVTHFFQKDKLWDLECGEAKQ